MLLFDVAAAPAAAAAAAAGAAAAAAAAAASPAARAAGAATVEATPRRRGRAVPVGALTSLPTALTPRGQCSRRGKRKKRNVPGGRPNSSGTSANSMRKGERGSAVACTYHTLGRTALWGI